MTTSKLDQIAARLEAATPGPWEAVTDNDGRTKEHSVWSEQSSDYVAEWIVTKPDADLIAHAPADIAALLAVVREVAALHQPEEWPSGLGEMVCRCCRNHPYPCPTATALAPLTEEDTDGR